MASYELSHADARYKYCKRTTLYLFPAPPQEGTIVAGTPIATMARVAWGNAVSLRELPPLSCGHVTFVHASASDEWQHRPWLGSCNEPTSPIDACSCGTDSSDCNSKLQHLFDTTVSEKYPHLFAGLEAEVSYSAAICDNPSGTVDIMPCNTGREWLFHLTSIIQQCCIGDRNSHYNSRYNWTPNCAEGCVCVLRA